MTVYIEYVILDNFLIDLVLLLLTAKVIKVHVSWWKYAFACSFGTAICFVLPLVSLPVIAGIAIKLVTGLIMCKICFFHQPFVVRFVANLVLLSLLYSLGGATIAFMFLLSKNPLETIKNNYFNTVPIGLLVAAAFCIISFALYLAKYIKERKTIAPFLRTIQIKIFGKTVELFGYLDSGNRLEDDVSGLPIVVVSKETLGKNFKSGLETLSASQTKAMRPHYIVASSATGQGKMLVLKPEYISIANEKKNALIGITEVKFNDIVRVDALFGPALA